MENIKLVKKAINGNEEAFETLVKNESDKLYRIAFLYVRNKEDALDVIQESIYKAFISIKQLKEAKYFQTWLTKILIRSCYDLLKKKKKVVSMDDKIERNFAGKSSGDMDGKIDLVYAVSSLNQNYKTVIILFYFRDLPIASIAKTMGKPENTIKTYLRRAKLELKGLLEGGSTYGQGAF